MAATLAKVRIKFVESVSTEVIKQLLDDLLEDGVLNEGEKDAVLEGTTLRDDRARLLIDKVKKKGDSASNKMIAHLQERDLTLFSNLGLSQSPPAQTSAEPKKEEQWATSLVPATDGFYKKQTQDTSVYPTSRDSMRNRVALLITNINFQGQSKRNGAETDEENMENLLKKLRYEVVKYRDRTAKQMNDALVEFSKHPKLKKTDSVFVVIMSHGKLDAVLGINDDELPIDRIYEHLGSEGCPALVDKPKVIIIQACRGIHTGAVEVSAEVESDSILEDVIEDTSLKYVHKEKDFISLLSTTPHTVAYRHRTEGSFFIQFIVKVFKTSAHEEHIDELFRKVMQRFEKFEIKDGRHIRKQMPTKDRCTLTKHLYLFPGQ